MAWSKLEKALAVAVGIDLAVPGTNRKVATALATQIGRRAVTTAPYAGAVGRAAVTGLAGAAYRRPRTALALGGLAAQQLGAFDPVEDALSREVERRVAEIQAIPEQLEMAVTSPVFKPAVKRKVSKYSKAVKAAMGAVKKSKFGGKPGKISNAKSVFSTVNKVASAVNKGKKVAKTGIRGVAARAARRFLR